MLKSSHLLFKFHEEDARKRSEGWALDHWEIVERLVEIDPKNKGENIYGVQIGIGAKL